MKKISLTRGKFALVDNENFDWLNQWKWTCTGAIGKGPTKKYYAYRQIRRKNTCKCILMHRLIMNFPIGKEIDHINRDGLDNRICNLREANRLQQMRNSCGNKNAEISYKGVSFSKDKKRKKIFRMRIRIENGKVVQKRFYTAIEAAKAYDRFALKYFGEFAYTNFEYKDKKGLRLKLKVLNK